MKNLTELKISNFDNIISLAVFGSYGTEFWIKDKSDIDVMVILNEKKEMSFEFNLEDELIPILQEFFSYNNIHLTFIYISEFESPLATKYIQSKNKLIINGDREIDFRLYINKFKRNNKWLEDLIESDNEHLRSEKSDTIL
ncbi:MAG: nucleotidyltransferase domain-containing protein [Clostridiaceae bacterium]